MIGRDKPSERYIRSYTTLFKRVIFFVTCGFVWLIGTLLAVDLMYGPILANLVRLPYPLHDWWLQIHGPGIIPLLILGFGFILVTLSLGLLVQASFNMLEFANFPPPILFVFRGGLFLFFFIPFVRLSIFSFNLIWGNIFPPLN